MKRHLISIGEAAELLNISTKTIRRRIADGTIPAYRVAGGRNIRLDVSDVDAQLRRIPTGGAA